MEEESPGIEEADDTPRLRDEKKPWQDWDQLLEALPDEDDEAYGSYDPPPIVRMVNAIIVTAIDKEASDIQLDLSQQYLHVRCRIDGVLQEIMRLPKHVQIPTFNRFKVMADIPFWRQTPGTGFIPIWHGKRNYNLLVASVRTGLGESLKVRILNPDTPNKPLYSLGLDRHTETAVQHAAYYGGLILIAGTPGAGKTTTAYGLLRRNNGGGWVTATLEDTETYKPFGLLQTYRKPGIVACQIADALIAQEARLVFCGDLVDTDMAEAALKIAEAGIVTIACVTAPSAAGALINLMRLGIAPSRLAAVLSGVLMQALVGMICPDCRASVPLGPDKAKRLTKLRVTPPSATPNDALPKALDFGEGCGTCHKRGIKGRTALFDFLELDEVTRRLIRADDAGARLSGSPFAYASANALHEAARVAVLEKRISLDEAERVIYPLAGAAQRML